MPKSCCICRSGARSAAAAAALTAAGFTNCLERRARLRRRPGRRRPSRHGRRLEGGRAALGAELSRSMMKPPANHDARRAGASPPSWFVAVSTARRTARPRKRSSSIPASSMTNRRRPSGASPARMTAMSMAATAIRPSPCSRNGCGCSRGPRPAMRVGSGMAAVFGALACQLKAGDHLVASQALFGSCYQIVTSILPRFGITRHLVDGNDLDAWRRRHHAGHQVRVPRNAVQSDARGDRPRRRSPNRQRVGACVVVDNIFATPILQKPLQLWRRCRGLFRHQAHRRAGPGAWRRDPLDAPSSRKTC